MKITIAERLKPFSHTPGSSCLIPGTAWQVQAFPLRFVFTEPSGKMHNYDVPLHGPVNDFTLLQDLERGCVAIFGTWQEGYFYWQIEVKENAIWLRLQRCPEQEHVHKGAIRIGSVIEKIGSASNERLAFGCHKKQEWELMHRRQDMAEILPFWFRLAQFTPAEEIPVSHPEKEELPEALRRLFLAHFGSLFLPIADDRHQGLQTRSSSVLHDGSKLVRHALFRETANSYSLLPALPSAWHCGRLINIAATSGDILDLEWSKKEIRRVVLRPVTTREITLVLPPAIKSFRVRTSLRSKGERHSVVTPLSLTAGTPLFLDRFEK